MKDIYFAEKKILEALPKMAKAAQSGELRVAFEYHKRETEEHVARLENFCRDGESPRGKTCDAIIGIIEEVQEVMKNSRVSRRWTQAFSPPRKRSSIMRLPGTAR